MVTIIAKNYLPLFQQIADSLKKIGLIGTLLGTFFLVSVEMPRSFIHDSKFGLVKAEVLYDLSDVEWIFLSINFHHLILSRLMFYANKHIFASL